MASQNVLKLLLLNTAAIALGAMVASSCVTVDYPPIAFRCNPRQSDNCPDDYFCCSDDPNPTFSGVNNGSSAVGMCVEVGAVPPAIAHPEIPQCPKTCDPQNPSCGAGLQCCQTVEITEKDCVLVGDTWRPATGEDIFAQRTDWSFGAHDTHQDPGAQVCLQIGNQDQSSPAFRACAEDLTVANRRGFCMPTCAVLNPSVNPNYRSACDCKNNPADPLCLQAG